MSDELMSFAKLIKLVRTKLGEDRGDTKPISQAELADLLEYSSKTISRWENGKYVEPSKIKLETFMRLAQYSGRPIWQLMEMLNYHEFFVPSSVAVKQVNTLRVAPLAEWPTTNEHIHNAVTRALEARRVYSLEGNLKKSARLYTYAIKSARDAKMPLLECYIMGFLGSVYEVLGGDYLTEADKVLNECEDLALQLQSQAKRTKDDVVTNIAGKLHVTTQLRKGWVLWSRNDYLGAISIAEKLRQPFSDYRLYRRRIYLNELLARASAGLGMFAAARMYIDEAVSFAYALPHVSQFEQDFFLEPGVDYEWKLDQILTVKMDIFILEGLIDEAFQAYQKINRHLEPRASISAHAWFNFRWQERLQTEMDKGTITEADDPKLGTSFADWDAYMSEGGVTHVRARLAHSQAEYELTSGKIEDAIIYYQRSITLAREAKADAVEVVSTLGCANAHIKLKEKTKAEALLIALQPKIHLLNNSMLRDAYSRTEEAMKALQDDSTIS